MYFCEEMNVMITILFGSYRKQFVDYFNYQKSVLRYVITELCLYFPYRIFMQNEVQDIKFVPWP